MATSQMYEVIQHLRRTVLLQDGAGMTDGQLLESFVSSRDEAAFAALVRRHGPMVWGVCRRVLSNHQDAEDAFQAAFLVLVRKAASVVPREMVANWLYGVAHQTALKARALAARRKGRERQVTQMPEAAAAEHDLWPDLQPLLDQELSRLSDKYRVVIVLCDLEGKTRQEAARQLGVPPGTVAGRLARARALLAKRLTRNGLTLSGGSLAAMLSQQAASAGVPAAVVSSTIHTASLLAAGQAAAVGVLSPKAAALTEGVLKAMLITRLKGIAVILVFIGMIALGSGMFTYRTMTGATANEPVIAAENARTLSVWDQETTVPRQRGQTREGITLAGTLQALDLDAHRVTVSVFSRTEGQSEKTFSVAKDAKVLRDGKEIKLTDLKQGNRITLRLSPDQKTVVGLVVANTAITAQVKAVDAARSTVTVVIDNARKGKQEKTYPVAKDAKVTLEGKEARLTDLKEGATLVFTISAEDGNTVIQIATLSRRVGRGEE
jgi:RNA polymerase sigma factor (sigma-70 family)